MSNWLALIALFNCLILFVYASSPLKSAILALGHRYKLTSSLLGLLVALGANSPELTSALSAIIFGEREVGSGVIIGSNIFNLAALLGISGLLSGGFQVSRPLVVLHGAVSLAATGCCALFLNGYLTLIWALGVLAIIFFFYLFAIGWPGVAARALPFPDFWKTVSNNSENEEFADTSATVWSSAGRVLLGLSAIVGAGIVTVHLTLDLGQQWGVPKKILGIFFLAGFTGIPNLLAAVDFARRQKGTAAVSEALNSNTLNIIFGIFIPAIFIQPTVSSQTAVAEVWILLGLTAFVITGIFIQTRLDRTLALAILMAYLCFSTWRLAVAYA